MKFEYFLYLKFGWFFFMVDVFCVLEKGEFVVIVIVGFYWGFGLLIMGIRFS